MRRRTCQYNSVLFMCTLVCIYIYIPFYFSSFLFFEGSGDWQKRIESLWK